MKRLRKIPYLFWLFFLPQQLFAQGLAEDIGGLQQVLDHLYVEMIPMCNGLMGVGRGLAGLGALCYIAARVWKHIAQAEPVDVFPLFRPFAIGLAILLYPSVIALFNAVLQPTVQATAGMVEDSHKAIAVLLQQKEAALSHTTRWQMYIGDSGSGDRDQWYRYEHPEDPDGSDETWLQSVGNDVRFAIEKASYGFRNSIKEWMSEILYTLYQAAALCINTIRTFYLIVLAVLGPIVFGLSVFDGLQYILTVWIARYINIFLWLPVANLFGAIISKIQERMLQLDLQQLQNTSDTFFSATDAAYLIFLIIGIIGYCTVPSVANYIVHAGGANTLLYKTSAFFSQTTQSALHGVSHVGGSMVNGVFEHTQGYPSDTLSSTAGDRGHFRDQSQAAETYSTHKLSGS